MAFGGREGAGVHELPRDQLRSGAPAHHFAQQGAGSVAGTVPVLGRRGLHVTEFSFTYRAFISYAHADHKWAVWLHRALERYRVPRRLAGAENVRRLGKCFRDEEELAAAAELGPKIAKALQSSDVLIVVCSPRSAKSTWVNQEIEAFKRQGREHRVFALIVDGTPHGAPDVAGNPTECFPPALKVTASGGLAEPLAVDVRKFGRDDAAVRLIAGMLDVGYDDLRQREVRRRRAEMFRAQSLFVTGLVLVAAALTGGWFAASNYVDASDRKARLFAREADILSANGDHARAMLMALYGNPAADNTLVERLLRPAGFTITREALNRAYAGNRLMATYRVAGPKIISMAMTRDGGKVFVGYSDGSAKLWSANQTPDIKSFTVGTEPPTFSNFSSDGELLLVGDAGGVAKVWNVKSLKTVQSFPKRSGYISAVAFSSDNARVLIGTPFDGLQVWKVGGQQPELVWHEDHFPLSAAIFSNDGTSAIAGSTEGEVRIFSLIKSESIGRFVAHSWIVGSIAQNRKGWVLTGSRDRTAHLTEMDGFTIDLLVGHTGNVTSAIFLDGEEEQILTASADTTVKLWDASGIPGEAQPVTLAGHDGEVLAISSGPSMETIVSASADGSIKYWRRNPTPEEGFQRLSAEEQVWATCDMLRKIGVTEFAEADYKRFPILDRSAPHPCAKIWGF